MKITGIKNAVGDYNRANKGECYSSHYGRIMLDRSTGEVWTDEFVGDGTYIAYAKEAIINLGRKIGNDNNTVSMKTVREYAERLCNEYNK